MIITNFFVGFWRDFCVRMRIVTNKNCITMIRTIFKNKEIQAIEEDKVLGKLQYSLSGNELSILHTYAYEQGRGIGSRLMRAAVQWATAHGYTIIPICSFAQKYLSTVSSS